MAKYQIKVEFRLVLPAALVEERPSTHRMLFVLSECVHASYKIGVCCAGNSLGLQSHYKGSVMFVVRQARP